MIFQFKKTQAAAIIREHFQMMEAGRENVLVSAKEAGRRMVEIYRLLTDEMPQSPGLEEFYGSDEEPAVEWATPNERRPDELFYVEPGFGGEPDILIKGDQDGTSQKESYEEIHGPQGCSPKALPEKGEGEGQGEQ
jgi:hypothetical protein